MAIREYLISGLDSVTWVSTLLRLVLAMLFGGAIGMERGRRRRAAGLRTHILVCVGAALVMITNQYIGENYGMTDPSRLGAQVISGIGFLGVGTIIVDRQQQVRGLTTAAGLWACACMGLALGIGFYSGAIIACVLIMSTIGALNRLEQRIIHKSRVMEVYAEFESYGDITPFLNHVASHSIKIVQLEIIRPRYHGERGDSKAAAIITFRLPKRRAHIKVLETLGEEQPGLLTLEEFQ